ncbi:acyl carrier protein, partial [Frankia sp. AgB32]|uniref:acyl carrier protein n=1 Tax=Frankia sp. AgB32 TaxID=631119 RepID=UPI00200DB60B
PPPPPAPPPARPAPAPRAPPAGAPPTASALRRELLGLPAGQRADRLLEYLLGEVAEVLGSDDDEVGPDQGFFDLGLDSVMAVNLTSRAGRALGATLPPTLTFEFPTTRALAQHLLDEMSAADGASASVTRQEPTRPAPEPDLDSFDDLTDDELMSRLGEALDGARALLGD